MKKLIVASALALAIATPAFAQDEAPEGRDTSYTGAWIAGIAGLDVLTIQENNEADAARGVLYGGSVGYDFAAGEDLVVGVQAELTNSGAAFEVDGLLVAGDQFRAEAGREIFGGARVGLRASGALLYISGGYVSAQATSVYRSPAGTIEDTETKGGFRVGLGGEFGKRNVFGRLEMRYQDLGDFTIFGTATGYARTNTQIVAGVGVRF